MSTTGEPMSLAKRAANNPTSFFHRPAEVVADARLSRDEKLAVPEAWELEARSLAVAAEENMRGGEPDLLAEVVKARLALGAETDPQARAGAPTKHGGRQVKAN
jgi:hypothetical protein